jgi:hypothetical protein
MWVVAAPYIETAVALGVAAGLRKRWLAQLFAFAPKPLVSYHAAAREPLADRRPRDDYPEFFGHALHAGGHAAVDGLWERSRAYLDQLERRGRCNGFTEAAVAALRERRRGTRRPI